MSDEYGQIGPEKPGYESDLDRIAFALNREVDGFADVLFTARSTAKHVVLALLDKTALFDARPEGLTGGGLFVGIDNGKAAWMPVDYLHWSYVAQYLGQSWGDGELDHPFTDFLNEILRRLHACDHSDPTRCEAEEHYEPKEDNPWRSGLDT